METAGGLVVSAFDNQRSTTSRQEETGVRTVDFFVYIFRVSTCQDRCIMRDCTDPFFRDIHLFLQQRAMRWRDKRTLFYFIFKSSFTPGKSSTPTGGERVFDVEKILQRVKTGAPLKVGLLMTTCFRNRIKTILKKDTEKIINKWKGKIKGKYLFRDRNVELRLFFFSRFFLIYAFVSF